MTLGISKFVGKKPLQCTKVLNFLSKKRADSLTRMFKFKKFPLLKKKRNGKKSGRVRRVKEERVLRRKRRKWERTQSKVKIKGREGENGKERK
jgi:hypothetical protein